MTIADIKTELGITAEIKFLPNDTRVVTFKSGDQVTYRDSLFVPSTKEEHNGHKFAFTIIEDNLLRHSASNKLYYTKTLIVPTEDNKVKQPFYSVYVGVEAEGTVSW